MIIVSLISKRRNVTHCCWTRIDDIIDLLEQINGDMVVTSDLICVFAEFVLLKFIDAIFSRLLDLYSAFMCFGLWLNSRQLKR